MRKVSVLLSVYNNASTLEKTLHSLFEQSFQDFDVVTINDASEDTSGALLDSWQKKFGSDRFKVIQNETNIGLTRSLNTGLNIIETPYTARLDADDWWSKNKLELQVRFLDKHPNIGVVGCAYINIYSDQECSVHPKTDPFEIRQDIIRRNPFAHSAVMFRTALVREVGGYDEHIRYGQDYDLWLRLLSHTELANLPDILCYRLMLNGISVTKQRAQMLQCMRLQIRYIRKYHRPWREYFFILDPLLVILTPHFLHSLKRKYFSKP